MAENKAKVDEKERLKKVADDMARARAPGQSSPTPVKPPPKKP